MTGLRGPALVAVAASRAVAAPVTDTPATSNPPTPATIVIAREPPPPVPPLPPPRDASFDDRWTAMASLAGLLMPRGDAIVAEATVTRTFDRAELAGTLAIGEWSNGRMPRAGGTIERAGIEARYQALRLRVETLTLDLCAEAGAGFRHEDSDDGTSSDRGDLSVGVVGRMLDRVDRRTWLGMEVSLRVLVAPGETDLMITGGLPLGI